VTLRFIFRHRTYESHGGGLLFVCIADGDLTCAIDGSGAQPDSNALDRRSHFLLDTNYTGVRPQND